MKCSSNCYFSVLQHVAEWLKNTFMFMRLFGTGVLESMITWLLRISRDYRYVAQVLAAEKRAQKEMFIEMVSCTFCYHFKSTFMFHSICLHEEWFWNWSGIFRKKKLALWMNKRKRWICVGARKLPLSTFKYLSRMTVWWNCTVTYNCREVTIRQKRKRSLLKTNLNFVVHTNHD